MSAGVENGLGEGPGLDIAVAHSYGRGPGVREKLCSKSVGDDIVRRAGAEPARFLLLGLIIRRNRVRMLLVGNLELFLATSSLVVRMSTTGVALVTLILGADGPCKGGVLMLC